MKLCRLRSCRFVAFGLFAWAGTAAAVVDPEAEHAPLPMATERCRHGELIACYAALSMKPNDPALLVAEADALVASKRPGEAIGVYRNARRSGAARDLVDPRIAAASAQRSSVLVTCENSSGAQAELACESAWLPGAPDELAVFKRRGLLLQQQTQPGAALDAYLAAARLAPHDRAVARSVVALSGTAGRSDAATLTARGAALVTLGRAAEAVVPLRRALKAAPNSIDAKGLLRTAQLALPTAVRAPVAANRAAIAAAPAQAATEALTAEASYSNSAPVTRSN